MRGKIRRQRTSQRPKSLGDVLHDECPDADSTKFHGAMKPIRAIYNTFAQPPSAELQQLAEKKGKR